MRVGRQRRLSVNERRSQRHVADDDGHGREGKRREKRARLDGQADQVGALQLQQALGLAYFLAVALPAQVCSTSSVPHVYRHRHRHRRSKTQRLRVDREKYS